ncbi:hypothetical protein ACCO45_005309 [Purpureocillium lilacinum]|uniref:Uncharacterized protein n=1 Tax=Purpureocillium lilacinum TaxID=33203 RepID=A0ACC4DVS1_PURLI
MDNIFHIKGTNMRPVSAALECFQSPQPSPSLQANTPTNLNERPACTSNQQAGLSPTTLALTGKGKPDVPPADPELGVSVVDEFQSAALDATGDLLLLRAVTYTVLDLTWLWKVKSQVPHRMPEVGVTVTGQFSRLRCDS